MFLTTNSKFLVLKIIIFCVITSPRILASDSTIVSYYKIGVEKGLASKQVNCGFQSSDGFVWLGTNHGLQRYDGKNFITYTKEKNGLQANLVTRIIEDQEQQLWIMYGFFGGLANPNIGKVDILDLKTNKIESFTKKYKNKFPFTETESGFIFSNSKKEIFFLIPGKNNEPQLKLFSYSAQKGIKMLNIFIDPETPLLVNDDFIFLVSNKKNYVHRLNDNKNFIIKPNNEKIYDYPFLITKNNILYYYHIKNKTISNINLNNLDNKNELLNNKLINKFENNKTLISHYENKTNSTLLFENGKNIYYFNGENTIKTLNENDWNNELKLNVFNQFVTNDNKHWICTSNGLYIIDLKKNRFEHILSNDKIKFNDKNLYQTRNLYEIKNNKFLFLCWKGFFIVEKTNKINRDYKFISSLNDSKYHTDGANFDGINISKFTRDKVKIYNINTKKIQLCASLTGGGWVGIKTNKNDMLFSNYNFIALQNDCNLMPLKNCNNEPLDAFWNQQFYYTRDSILWAAGSNGLYTISNENCIQHHYYKEAKDLNYKIPNNNINGMIEDKEGVIWLATAEIGLIKWERKKNNFEIFSTENGLSSNTLYSILDDEMGYLWISSDYGLMRFNPKNNSVKIFTTADGLSNNEFNRASFLKASDGKLLFGGLNGINTFDPKDFWSDTINNSFPLKIISLNTFNNKLKNNFDKTEEVLKTNTIIINPSDGFFILQFQLLDFNSGENKYAYMIEGIDKNWIYINENYIKISGLPYGEYQIKIKGYNSQGIYSNKMLDIKLIIITPLLSKWWFKLLLLLFSIAIIYWYLKFKTKKLIADKNKLENIVNIRTAALNETLEQKEILLKEIHHRVKNNLSVIISLLNLQASNIDDELAIIALEESQQRIGSIALIHEQLYKNDHVGKVELKIFLVEMYEQILKVFLKTDSKILCQFKIPKVHLDINTAIPIGLIVNELITNSFKYAFNDKSVGNITIELLILETNKYTIIYSDNGPGLKNNLEFSNNKTLGFRLIQMLAKQLNGSSNYISDETGKRFEIIFIDVKK